MKDFLVNILKLLLSILIIFFTEEYFFKTLEFIGIHLSETKFVNLIIYVLEFGLIYFLYHRELNSAFSKYQNKLGNNVLYTIISYIVLFITMMITNYLVKLIANNLNINYSGLGLVNIFNKSFDGDLIILFLVSMLIIPFVKVTIFVLGVNNLINGKSGIFFSGLLYALYEAFLIGGEFGHVFIDVIDDFVLFVILSYLYKKNGNIAFSILTFIFYELFSGLLIAKLM